MASGERVKKNALRIEAYGTVDELNSQLGLLATYLQHPDQVAIVEDIQRGLFRVGGILATVPKGEGLIAFPAEKIAELERVIDEMDASLPPLHSFILPAGSRAACVAHVCRTVCRRAERNIISLAEISQIDANLLSYMNRLSDFLFIFSRKLNFQEQMTEKTV